VEKIKENNGVFHGLLFALIAVGLGLVIYAISKPLFLSPGLRFVLSLFIPITLMSRAALEERKKMGGYISFSEAIQPAYICLIIGTIAFAIFQYVIMNMDYELLEIQRDIAVESIQAIKDLANLSEENVASFQEITPEDLKPNLQALMLGLAKNFILGFIIAAIIAAIVKRKNIASE